MGTYINYTVYKMETGVNENPVSAEVIGEINRDVEAGYVCVDRCGWVASTEDGEPEPRYECGACGTAFSKSSSHDGDSNRCPDCQKFSARNGMSCPDCDGEAESCFITKCIKCDEWVEVGDLDDHLSGCIEP